MADNERVVAIEEQDEQEIDLAVLFADIVRGVRKYWLGCVALCLILGCLAFVAGVCIYRPEYVCQASFTVQTAQGISESDVSVYSFNYNSTTASRLSGAFETLAESDLMRKTVMQDLGLETLASTISVEALSDTNMFTLTVTDSNAQRAYDVAVSIMENYSRITDKVIGDTKLYMLVQPTVPESAANRLSAFKMAVTAVMLGVVLDGVFILAYALMRSTVRTREEVRTKLNQSCLAMVPQVKFMRGRRVQSQIVHFKNRKTGAGFRESIRSLRVSLLKALPQDAKVLLVTSTMAGEGKTTISVNLAGMLAMMGRRVLLIDADMRGQSVLNAMRLDGEARPGLAEVLAGKVTPARAIRMEEKFQISVLAGTETSAEAAQLLHSGELSGLLGRLKEEYDFIVLDCPPCGVVSDAAVLGGLSDAAVLVVRQDAVSVSEILGGIENLTVSGVPLLGCVLNGVASGAGGYGQYGKYGSYGRYGDYSHGEK